jgi:hypothetical protein
MSNHMFLINSQVEAVKFLVSQPQAVLLSRWLIHENTS